MTGRGTEPGPVSTGRRQLTVMVAACALGSGLALLAAGRQWAVTVQVRPAPLVAAHLSRTGAAIAPWLSALALVGLAGAGALLATRGGSRIAVGILIVLAGIGVAVAGGYALFAVAGVRPGWPLLCLPAGVLIGAAGVVTVRRGGTWPSMGGRYDRGDRLRSAGSVPPAAAGSPQRGRPYPSDVAMWDALDRGEDPTRPGGGVDP